MSLKKTLPAVNKRPNLTELGFAELIVTPEAAMSGNETEVLTIVGLAIYTHLIIECHHHHSTVYYP